MSDYVAAFVLAGLDRRSHRSEFSPIGWIFRGPTLSREIGRDASAYINRGPREVLARGGFRGSPLKKQNSVSFPLRYDCGMVQAEGWPGLENPS